MRGKASRGARGTATTNPAWGPVPAACLKGAQPDPPPWP